jgi:purine-binding chemotaxis protein CheW
LRGYDTVTRIANSAEYIKGVVNLRGVIVPIIDMRIKLNLGDPTYDQFTVVVILSVGAKVMGMVVDSVSDVITLTPAQIKPAPDMGSAMNTDYVVGIAAIEQRMLILVDIGKLISGSDIALFDTLAA